MRKSSRLLALASVAALTVVTSAQAESIYAITGASAGVNLVSFDSASPGTAVTVGSLSGVVAGHSLRAIDFRPADAQLYALSTGTGGAFQLYTVNLSTAALTPVGAGGTVSFAWPTRVSMDFNPAADRIRVVTGGANNLRLNPITGALVAEDTALSYVAGDPNAAGNPPFPVGVAYDNNDTNPSTTTTMYVFDFDNDVLSRVGDFGGSPISPNSGQMNTLGGPPPGTFVTFDGGVGFDISGVTGTGFLSYAESVAGVETFGTINLTNGSVTPIGTFNQLDILDISAVIPEPTTLSIAGIAALGMLRRRRD
jgi:hypothetical protein